MRKFLGLGAALWLAASAGWAVDWKILKPQGYVSDFAGVVDPASKAHLETYGAEVERATGARIYLVTVPSLQGEPLPDVARTIARAWRVEGPGGDQGVLLLLAIGDRRSRLEIGSALQPVLPGGLQNRVMQQMRPALRLQNYGEVMMAAAETIGGSLARARKVRLNASLPRRLRPTITDVAPWPFVLFGISELFLFAILFYAPWRGRWRLSGPATESGGGFGSYDSSDSFGGFGGGEGSRSGPGAASCGW